MSRKCLRCGEECGKELYCYWCSRGFPPTYVKSKREIAFEKRLFGKLRQNIEEYEAKHGPIDTQKRFNPSRRYRKIAEV